MRYVGLIHSTRKKVVAERWVMLRNPVQSAGTAPIENLVNSRVPHSGHLVRRLVEAFHRLFNQVIDHGVEVVGFLIDSQLTVGAGALL